MDIIEQQIIACSRDIEFRKIDNEVDFDSIKPLGWDLVIGTVPYDVYMIDGYYHTIGGRFGENNYWCCRSNEKPSPKTLIAFSGNAPRWGIVWEETNYIKTKWDETKVNQGGRWFILRNGKKFYEGGAIDIGFGLASAQVALTKLQEHPIAFGHRNWKEELLGRKIYYNDEPAIVEIIFTGELWIIPDIEAGIKMFKPTSWMQEETDDFDSEGYYSEYKDGCKVDFLDGKINWFRKI